MMVNILYISLRADYGGGSSHLDALVHHLSGDFRIFLAIPKDKPYYDQWVGNEKVADCFVLEHRTFSFIKFFQLLFFVKQNNIQIVHSHGRGAGVYSRLLKVFSPHIKVVHTLHGFHQDTRSLFLFAILWLETLLKPLTDRIIHVSKGEQKQAVSAGVSSLEKSSVIHNGVEALVACHDAKSVLGLAGCFVCMSVSRFDYAKNMQLAYNIAKALKHEKITFLWVGDGDDRQALERQSLIDGCNIVFTGFQKDVVLYLSAADVLLSSSRWEGLPLALLEAQSLSLPIVATNVVGNNEVVEDGVSGCLYDNESEACEALLMLMRDTDALKRIGCNGYANFQHNFTLQSMIQETEKVYRELLA